MEVYSRNREKASRSVRPYRAKAQADSTSSSGTAKMALTSEEGQKLERLNCRGELDKCVSDSTFLKILTHYIRRTREEAVSRGLQSARNAVVKKQQILQGTVEQYFEYRYQVLLNDLRTFGPKFATDVLESISSKFQALDDGLRTTSDLILNLAGAQKEWDEVERIRHEIKTIILHLEDLVVYAGQDIETVEQAFKDKEMLWQIMSI